MILSLAAGTGMVGCKSEETGPYVKIEGGGFIFNYRIAEAYYGFVARPLRDLPEGGSLEARFDNPDGSEPLVVRHPVRPNAIKYTFRTPPLKNVVANHDYHARLVVLDTDGATELGRYDKTFRTYIGQSVVPGKPLTVGPGYALNPEVDWSDLPGKRPPPKPQ